jgi:uncharacterized protein (DUF2141 family)
MKMNTPFIRISAYFLISLLIFSCAQVMSPGGGPRDTAPPKVTRYIPDSAQLNFNSRIIEITFDEYIQLKDLNTQLIISPPVENTPDINVKGKTLTIDLNKEKLKPNTTYSINFGNSIQDINENNSKENFNYIFSTGNFIDSLSVKGQIQNAFDHKTEKGVLVMLYSDLNDSAVYKNQPDYFSKTTADGNFKINNIKGGKYKIAAVKDLNGNYKYDGEAESVGFYDTIIDPSIKKNIKIDIFQEPAKKVFLKKYFHNSYGKIVLVFNQGSDSLQITNLTNNKKGVQEFIYFSKNKDTLTYWMKNYKEDSVKLQVNNGKTVIDTVEFKTIQFEDAIKGKRSPLKLRLLNNFNGNQNFDLGSNLILKFSQPIATVSEAMPVNFKRDSIPLDYLSFIKYNLFDSYGLLLSFSDSSMTIEDTIHHGVFIPAQTASINYQESTNYHLFVLPGTFTDIFGLTNDTIKIDFKTRELKYYGSLKLNINIPEAKGKYIVQLLDEKENIIRKNIISGTETINYEFLHPSKYKLKIIMDENANGKWDSGNYLKKINPEKVIYNMEEINIRSNWDAEIEWKITN